MGWGCRVPEVLRAQDGEGWGGRGLRGRGARTQNSCKHLSGATDSTDGILRKGRQRP